MKNCRSEASTDELLNAAGEAYADACEMLELSTQLLTQTCELLRSTARCLATSRSARSGHSAPRQDNARPKLRKGSSPYNLRPLLQQVPAIQGALPAPPVLDETPLKLASGQ